MFIFLFQSFQQAMYAVNYMIYGVFSFNSAPQTLQMTNILTEERLTMSSCVTSLPNGAQITEVMMLRSALDFDNDDYDAWLAFANKDGARPANLVHIGFNDDEIG